MPVKGALHWFPEMPDPLVIIEEWKPYPPHRRRPIKISDHIHMTKHKGTPCDRCCVWTIHPPHHRPAHPPNAPRQPQSRRATPATLSTQLPASHRSCSTRSTLASTAQLCKPARQAETFLSCKVPHWDIALADACGCALKRCLLGIIEPLGKPCLVTTLRHSFSGVQSARTPGAFACGSRNCMFMSDT